MSARFSSLPVAVRPAAAALLAAAVLTGCSLDPTAIRPAYVSQIGYESLSCTTLRTRLAEADATVKRLEGEVGAGSQLDRLVEGTTALVVGSHDQRLVAISKAKGDQNALRAAAKARDCKLDGGA
jgi:hypothetical protein